MTEMTYYSWRTKVKGMRSINIAVSEDFHAALKKLSQETGKSMTRIIVEAVQAVHTDA